MERGGNLIIPAFAVGRTQTLLYYFYKLWKAGRIEDVPIILDSPLAIAATRIFIHNSQEFDDEAMGLLLENGSMPQMPQLKISETAAESKALNSSEGSAIIISASGMADAGRILHHLKHNLWRPESTVLFVGYQAQGTLGRLLVDGAKQVRIQGEGYDVAARIRVIDLYSGHADGPELTAWIAARAPVRQALFLTHGEPPAMEALARTEAEALAPLPVLQPALDASYLLTPNGPQEVSEGHDRPAPRLHPAAVANLDWHNDVSKLFLDLNEALSGAGDEKARGVLIRHLRAALEDWQAGHGG